MAFFSSGGGGSSVAIGLETATPAVGDGIETQFVFVGTPVLVMCNGVVYSPDNCTVAGTTATIPVPPETGRQITALTTTG